MQNPKKNMKPNQKKKLKPKLTKWKAILRTKPSKKRLNQNRVLRKRQPKSPKKRVNLTSLNRRTKKLLKRKRRKLKMILSKNRQAKTMKPKKHIPRKSKAAKRYHSFARLLMPWMKWKLPQLNSSGALTAMPMAEWMLLN